MNSRALDNLARCLRAWIVSAAALPSLALGDSNCARFPRDSVDPVVEVCADETHYNFRLGDVARSFHKRDFEYQINAAILGWLASHNESADIASQAIVEIWMSVPEANPEAAQPRAVVTTSKGQISFWFDLAGESWAFGDTETALLDQGIYPETFGHRPRRLLIKAQPGASTSDVAAALTKEGMTGISSQGGDWYTANCQLFEESARADAALKNQRHVLKYVQVNSVVEWIAERQMAFSFPLTGPSE